MSRRKIIVTALAVFAIGVAFASQSISGRSDRSAERVQRVSPWVPGTNMLMSAHEAGVELFAPPR